MVKIAATVIGAITALIVIITAAVAGVVSTLIGANSVVGGAPSPVALSDIPADYLALYQQAAGECPGLDWAVLAAVGKVETSHGRLNAPGVHSGSNSAGAQGPMQFLPATFAAYAEPVPPGGNHPPSPYDPVNAIYAASRYLCDSGARDGHDVYGAIFAYNRADWYVRKVLDQAQAYRAAAPAAGGWVVPVDGRCSSGFGFRDGEFHAGQDLAAAIGTPIVAASDGTVLDAGPASGYGLWVRVQHPDGVVSTYGHNHRNLVHRGQPVHAGQPIAEVGNRGESTGPHLHFQLEEGGQPIDPLLYYRHRSAPWSCG